MECSLRSAREISFETEEKTGVNGRSWQGHVTRFPRSRDALGAGDLAAGDIRVAEGAVVEAEDGDVGY